MLPGSFVILKSESSVADDLSWVLANPPKGHQFYVVEGTDSEVYLTSIMVPGTYYFVLSASKALPEVGSSCHSVTHTLVVRGSSPPTPKPDEPDEPDKPVDPNPEPNLTGFEKQIFDALKQVSVPLAQVEEVARNLKVVAGKAAGLSWDAGDMNSELMRLNAEYISEETKEKWSPWTKAVNPKFVSIRPETPSGEVVPVYNEIADAMVIFIDWKKTSGTVMQSNPDGNSLLDVMNALKGNVSGLKGDLDSIKREIGVE